MKGIKVKQIFLSAILIVIVLMGGTGCMIGSKPEKGVNDMALDYLEQKYGEKFEYSKPCGNSMTGTRTFYASCASVGIILVQIDNYKSEDRTFRDNYLAVKYENDTLDFIKNISAEEFAESKVYYKHADNALFDTLSANASFEEFLADTDGFITTVIGVKRSNYSNEEQLKNTVQKLSSICKANNLSILIVVLEDNEYQDADEAEFRNRVVSRRFVKCARFTRQDGSNDLEIMGE